MSISRTTDMAKISHKLIKMVKNLLSVCQSLDFTVQVVRLIIQLQMNRWSRTYMIFVLNYLIHVCLIFIVLSRVITNSTPSDLCQNGHGRRPFLEDPPNQLATIESEDSKSDVFRKSIFRWTPENLQYWTLVFKIYATIYMIRAKSHPSMV